MPRDSPTLAALRGETGRVILALSGKDSMIAGCLAADLGFQIEAVHLYLVPDLLCIEEPLIDAAAKMGARYSTYPTHYLGRILHYGVLCDPMPEAPGDLTLPDVEDALRRRLGAEWVVAGRRLGEVNEFHHAAQMRRCRGRFEGVRRIEAIWDWSKAEVNGAFLPGGVCHDRDIPRPSPIGPSDKNGRGVGRGLNLFGRHLLWLWHVSQGRQLDMPRCAHRPNCWQRLCRQFPFAPAAVARYLHHGPEVESLKHHLALIRRSA